MERRWDLDLTYVTERILAAAFPARPDEERHRSHLRELAHVLQSKHRDKYLVRRGLPPPANGRAGRPGWARLRPDVTPSEAGPGALEPPWSAHDSGNLLILEKDSQGPSGCYHLHASGLKPPPFLAVLQPFGKKTRPDPPKSQGRKALKPSNRIIPTQEAPSLLVIYSSNWYLLHA